MSLVGPRPERPEFVTELERDIPHYQARHAVVPGITGLAQLHLPPDTEVAHVERKLTYDLYYARHRGAAAGPDDPVRHGTEGARSAVPAGAGGGAGSQGRRAGDDPVPNAAAAVVESGVILFRGERSKHFCGSVGFARRETKTANMDVPFVTVIVPVRNEEAFLEATLRPLLNQRLSHRSI